MATTLYSRPISQYMAVGETHYYGDRSSMQCAMCAKNDIERDILISIASKHKLNIVIYITHTRNNFSNSVIEIFKFIKRLQTYGLYNR